MSILVLGGAGYIGSHALRQLLKKNYEVVVIDDLSLGHRKAIPTEVTFYKGDIRKRSFLREVFQKEEIDSVIHFAANSLVGESFQDPLKYFNNNVGGMEILLEVMKEFSVKQLVFSSTAAVYGEPEEVPILETAPTQPKNPYGESKLMMEKMINWCDQAYGIRYVALRYFNVAGADESAEIGEDHYPESHLIPLILQVALGQREKPIIYGEDYPTPDGTCIRDYIHVNDLSVAHILALEYLKAGNQSAAFNLGSSQGYSVKGIVEAAREVTGKDIPVEIVERRAGDPSTLIASSEKARTILDWQPQYTEIKDIIQTAWNWHNAHPKGYDDKQV